MNDPRVFAVTKNKEFFFWMYGDLFQKVSKINNTGLCDTQKNAVLRALEEGNARIKNADTKELLYVKDKVNFFEMDDGGDLE
jgi:hypothetical protein